MEPAFIEVARKGVKRMDSVSAFSMPESIGGATGAIKLSSGLSGGDDGHAGSNKRGATKSNCTC